MSSLDCDETDRLSALKNGGYGFSRRMMLDISIMSRDGASRHSALNDVVLFKDTYSKLPEYEVRINGDTATKFRADGVIFSTPTGSTAYALSAGGPILAPTIECIQMTPLCAHTLFNRPMIFSGSDTVSVSFKGYEGSSVSISVDGESGIAFEDGDEIVIKRSDVKLDLIDIGGRSFYSAVSEKLMTPLK